MTQVPASSHGGSLPSQWTVDDNGALLITLTGASGDHDFAHAFRVFNADGSALFVTDSSGDVNLFAADASTHMSYQTLAGSGPTWDVDENAITHKVYPKLSGAVIHVAPADGQINGGEVAWWFDQTNGAAKLMLKGKTADGTVVSAAIALA